MEKTTAIILAGGLGTRLRAVISDRPKVLAPVLGRPFLSYLLNQVAVAGGRRVILCNGYMGDKVRDTLGDAYRGMSLVHLRESSPLGTGGALRTALPYVTSENIVVMNGDSYFDVDLRQLMAAHTTTNAQATLSVAQVPDTQRFGRVAFDDAQRVLAFEEKGSAVGPGWINAGIYAMRRNLPTTIPANEVVSLERQVFPSWIGKGLFAFASSGRFLDIGTPESYEAATEFFASFQEAVS